MLKNLRQIFSKYHIHSENKVKNYPDLKFIVQRGKTLKSLPDQEQTNQIRY